MATYREFQEVLRKVGSTLERPRKHEFWKRKKTDGSGRTVVLSHRHGRDIPTKLFHRLLRQAGLSGDDFDRLRKDP